MAIREDRVLKGEGGESRIRRKLKTYIPILEITHPLQWIFLGFAIGEGNYSMAKNSECFQYGDFSLYVLGQRLWCQGPGEYNRSKGGVCSRLRAAIREVCVCIYVWDLMCLFSREGSSVYISLTAAIPRRRKSLSLYIRPRSVDDGDNDSDGPPRQKKSLAPWERYCRGNVITDNSFIPPESICAHQRETFTWTETGLSRMW